MLWLTAVVILAVGASGCGGVSAEQRARDRSENLSKLTPVLLNELRAEGSEVRVTCRARIGAFNRALTSIEEGIRRTEADVYAAQEFLENVSPGLLDSAALAHARLTANGIGDLPPVCRRSLSDLVSAQKQYTSALALYYLCITTPKACTNQEANDIGSGFRSAADSIEAAGQRLAGLTVKTPADLGLFSFPRSSDAVGNSVYGSIERLVCSGPTSLKGCRPLRDTLQGGVEAEEEDDVDAAVAEMVEALDIKG